MAGLMNPYPGNGKLNTVPSHAKGPPAPPPGPPARAMPPGRVAARMPPRVAPRAGPKAASLGAAPGAPRAQKASPQEQAAYAQFVNNGIKLIYDKKGLPALVKSLDGNGNPVEGLGNTVATIVQRLVDTAKQAGRPLSPAVVLHGAGALIQVLADLSKESGGHAYTDQELTTLVTQIIQNIGQTPEGQEPNEPAPGGPPGPQPMPPPGTGPPGPGAGRPAPMMGFPG